MTSRVLITGATGAVGPRVVRAFHEAGYVIRTLALDPPQPGIWDDSVEELIGDVTDKSVMEAATADVDTVIHLAAMLHRINPPPELQEEYQRINVKGTKAVVDAALKYNVRRLVFFSTIAVYGPSGGTILTENSPTRPATFYARTKSVAETIVLSARRTDGSALGTVLRLGAVYGAKIKGNYYRLVHSLAKGRFIPLGPGLNRRTLIYDKDVAQAAMLAAENDAAAGKIFNVSDGRFHTLKDIINALCNALGRSYPLLTLPVGPARVLAACIEKGFNLAGLEPPITRMAIDTYTEDIAVDGRRIKDELGFAPRYNLVEGWKDAVEDMRKMGDL